MPSAGVPGSSPSMPGASRSTPGADPGRGSDSAGGSKSRSRQQSGEGDQTASSDSDGVDTEGENSEDVSFEEPEETSRADGGDQSDGSSGDLSVEAAVDDKVLQEAFEVFDAQNGADSGQPDAGATDGAGGRQAGNGSENGGSTSAGASGKNRGGTAADRLGELNAELDSALGTFDGVILAERDAVKSSDNARTDGGDNESDEALDDEGEDLDGGFVIPAAPRVPGSGSAQQAGSDGSENSNGGGTQPAQGGSNRKGDYQHAGADTVPADIPDGSDDDVVARQIREAAQRETDPELREKLWDEYRKYKKGK